MKTLPSIALALALCSSAARAEAPQPNSIVIDCASVSLPTLRQVGDLLGQHNAGQIYASRSRLLGEARRDCKRGADHVVLVVDPAGDARGRLAQQAVR
ncbi:MAG: hypothetical protein ABIO38_06730 [Luteimonas sp.]